MQEANLPQANKFIFLLKLQHRALDKRRADKRTRLPRHYDCRLDPREAESFTSTGREL